MEQGLRDRPDWRVAAPYAPLLGADRAIIAWEWLRRDANYCEAATYGVGAPEDWGLHAFEPPHMACPGARPVWSAAANPYVLLTEAHGPPVLSEDALDLKRFADVSRIVVSGGRERLLICDGLRTIRLDVACGTLLQGPVRLSYRLAGVNSAERPLLTLRRLLAFQRCGRFARSLHPRQARARRWVLMLRAWDALTMGADQREIAAILLSREAAEPRWRSAAPSVRSRAQRLVRSARAMARGGYLELLR